MVESRKVPKLWGARNSGHSYKARMFLMLAGVPHEYQAVELAAPRHHRPAEFQQLATFGEVPVLQHGLQVLVQSNAILLYLAREFDRFTVSGKAGKDEITSWLFWEANRIGRSYPNLRYCRLFDASTDKGLVTWFEATCAADLARLDAQLEGRNFLLGQMTIADLSCAGYLLYGDDPQLDLTPFANVSAWLDRIRAQPGWCHPLEVMGSLEGNGEAQA